MPDAFLEGASPGSSGVCILPWNSQYSEAKWPVGEREMFVACFLSHDGQLLTIRCRVSAVEADALLEDQH